MKTPAVGPGDSMSRMTTIGGVGQSVFASVMPLRYLEGANLQDELSLTQNHTHLANKPVFSIALRAVLNRECDKGRIFYSCYTGNRRPEIMIGCRFFYHTEVGKVGLVKISLIQIESKTRELWNYRVVTTALN